MIGSRKDSHLNFYCDTRKNNIQMSQLEGNDKVACEVQWEIFEDYKTTPKNTSKRKVFTATSASLGKGEIEITVTKEVDGNWTRFFIISVSQADGTCSPIASTDVSDEIPHKFNIKEVDSGKVFIIVYCNDQATLNLSSNSADDKILKVSNYTEKGSQRLDLDKFDVLKAKFTSNLLQKHVKQYN